LNRITLTKIVDTKPAPRKPAPSVPVMTAAQLGDRIAKLAADVASFRANSRVDEVFEALAKRDTATACELLRDPATYEA
jgi:hypothetical protein